MSKSVGNVVEPQEIIERSGAEILRLWVSMVDYREEVRIGPQILARVVEALPQDPEHLADSGGEPLRL